jgi:hypothetical protein
MMMETQAWPERVAAGEFRIGSVLNRAWRVLSGNFLTFGAVTAVASLPGILFASPGQRTALVVAGAIVTDVMRRLSQAMLVYAAFQEMRGTRASLGESVRVGWHRILAVIGLAISASVLTALGFLLLIVPGLMVATMLFVATPVCVVERLGPFGSLERSAQLTKGHRWKIFGLLILAVVPFAIAGALFDELAEVADFGGVLAPISQVIGNAIWEAIFAVLVIATYHDLRVARDGVDVEQIAAVFE